MATKRTRKMKNGENGSRHSGGSTFMWKSGSKLKQAKQARHVTYIDKLKSGEKQLGNLRDAQQFFRILSRDYEDCKRLVLKFDEAMENVLMEATNLLYPDISEPLKLLGAIGQEEALTHGVYRGRTLSCFKTLFHAPNFMLVLSQKLQTDNIQGPKDHSIIAWFLLQLGKTGDEEILQNPLAQDVIEIFKTSNQVGFPQLFNQLKTVYQQTMNTKEQDTFQDALEDLPFGNTTDSLVAAQLLMRPPGVRNHDNDKENFRSISIIPTISELQCEELPYLPLAVAKSEYIDNEEAALLDRQFRLMREDLIGTIKDELQKELGVVVKQRRRLFPEPFLIDFGLKPDPHVVIRTHIPTRLQQRIQAMKNSEATNFFEAGPGKRVLQKGTMVIILQGVYHAISALNINDVKISCVGTIVERSNPLKIVKIPGTKKCRRVLEVGVKFTSESMRAIVPLVQKLENKKMGVPLTVNNDGALFNVSAGLFSIEPILNALIRMDEIPMRDQLVFLQEPTVPNVAHGGKSFVDLSPSLQKAVVSDEAQKEALEAMFNSNTLIVQGPPGTGKTYIGVQMVKAMLEIQDKFPTGDPLKILCLCYTNHALDSFLLDLVEAGVPKDLFIRLGSSPKIDPKIKSRCLGEVGSKINTDFGPTEKRAYGALKTEAETLEHRFKELLGDINKSSWGKSVLWWRRIHEWIEDNYYEEHEQLQIPDERVSDGFTRTGKSGKALQCNYLWERWYSGQGRGIFQIQDEALTGVWALKKNERKGLIARWNKEWLEPQIDLLQSTMQSLQDNTEALRTLRRNNDLRVLEKAKIIGCTTVGAARYQGMVNPNIVIIEEAGEILESHLLANLGDSCKQLIMIGDHKQLRPKIENYALQKESKNGFDLNVSLFERLVMTSESKIPVFPLRIQHRMRPEISCIIRGMGLYDSLLDHDNTKGRENVAGVTNNVIFIDHRNPEKADETTAALGMETKVNPFEAEMVVNIAKYVLQQGQYTTDQITILTPYLGQLSLIRKKLNDTDMGSFMSDQDLGDLARHDIKNDSNGSSSTTQKIRIATVDNFQGEESHVVIVSLVRSETKDGRIGFLSSEERVNVLFSRAREGMYIVGNLKTLSTSKSGRSLWSNIGAILEQNNQRLDYFPAKCQRHNSLSMIKTSADFLSHCPDGGCDLRCRTILSCGHQCPKKCHGNENDMHRSIMCNAKVEDICSNGHTQLRECSGSVMCKNQMKWTCPRGCSLVGKCHLGRPRTCKSCEELDKFNKELKRKEEKDVQELLKHEHKVAIVKSKVSAMRKSQETSKRLTMLSREQALLEKQLSEFDNPNSLLSCQPILAVCNTLNKDDMKMAAHDAIFEPKYDYNAPRLESTNVVVEVAAHINAQDNKNDEELSMSIVELTYDDATSRKSSNSMGINNDVESDSHCNEVKNSKTSSKGMASSSLLQDPDFVDALQRYCDAKFLEADDLIDNCLKKNPGEAVKKTLRAFQYILHFSLDPLEETWAEIESDGMKELPLSFENSLSYWATFLSLSSTKEYPSVTKEIANLFLTFVSSHVFTTLVDGVLKVGKSHAEMAIEKSDQQIKNSRSKQPIDAQDAELIKMNREWTDICRKDPDAPSVMNEEVMPMIGLSEIKRALMDQYHRIKIAQRQKDSAASSYNVRFQGNPGTGKTTIARHYCKFLQQLNVLPEESTVHDITAASLKNKGVSYLEDLLNQIKEGGGGVIFIDEAYQLANDKIGESLLDFILPIAESLNSLFGKLVWIVAGYPKEMEKLFEHNVGLPSRFPHVFTFSDYTAQEMQLIFESFMMFKEQYVEPESKSKNKIKSNLLKTIPIPQNPNQTRRRMVFDYTHGEVYDDRFGNSWTCDHDKRMWIDLYGNSTGYHPIDIGSTSNPLASKDGQIWTQDGKVWTSNNGDEQSHIPGTSKLKGSGKKILRQPPFQCEDEKYIRIAMRRLERRANRPGFGNARAVRTFFDIVRERQARRIAKVLTKGPIIDLYLLTKEDLLGKSLTEAQMKESDAYRKLQHMEGLVPVKEQIDRLIQLGTSNQKREEAEKPLLQIMLNRVFLGNPGTGKTTVAKIYGKLLEEMGLLSKGEVIVKNPSDFKGDVIGSSEKSTRDILRAAEGNVLVIDEAYALCTGDNLKGYSDPYGKAVIDTLVEQIQARPGDDRAVLMLGYRKEMEVMFKNVNPGLSRRFQLDQAYEFPDYDDEALLKILRSKAKESTLSISVSTAKRVVRSLAKARAKPNFGNAGAVDSLLSHAKEHMQKRDGTADQLTLSDFSISDQSSIDESGLARIFEGFVGMDSVINKLEELKSVVKFAKARGENPEDSISFNYLFLGNPGTGKTSIARCMGKMFKMLGLLPDDEVYECTPKDLITGFIGQAGHKTEEILEKSRGGVLFIDEAYQLNPQRGGSFMQEALDELCAKLTDVAFKGKILVLLAGYDADMDEMLSSNPGLKSRFAERLEFKDLSIEATRDLIALKLEKKKIPLVNQDVKSEELLSLSRKLVASKDFANGRDVDTVCDRTYTQLAKRSSRDHRIKVSLADVREAIESLLLSRQPQEGSKICNKRDFTHNEQTRELTMNDLSNFTSQNTKVQTEQLSESEEEEDQAQAQAQAQKEDNIDGTDGKNPFDALDSHHLQNLQDIIEKMGLNSKEGMYKILSSHYDQDIIHGLMQSLGISKDGARKILDDWKKAHKEVQRKKKKFKGMEAIWHCAVCGRGGLPTPVCYVAPYISGYHPIEG